MKGITESDSFLERRFGLTEYGTDAKTEMVAGATTFVTMAYALIVIPSFLADAGMPPAGLFTSVALISIIGTFIQGFFANLPLATAPGLGLSIFFAYTVVGRMGYTWQQGLAAVTISGVLFIIISVTSIREIVIDSLPVNIKTSITGGIGLFIALIGFKNSGIVAVAQDGMKFGDLNDPSVLLSLGGLMLMLTFMSRGYKAAIILSILITTIVGIPLGITNVTNIQLFSLPPSIGDIFLKQDFIGLLGQGGFGKAMLNIAIIILTISLVDLFDNIGTLLAVGQKGNMMDEDGNIRNMKRALISDSVSTTISSFLGATTTSTYLECSAGIVAGGRTGLTAVTTGVLFVFAMFFSGIVGIIPGAATAPALIVIGVLMLGSVTSIDFSDITESAPAFFTISLMPFTNSIAEGIAGGIISYVILKIVSGKIRQIRPAMYILAILFIIRFATI